MTQRLRARKGDGRNPRTLQNGFAIREFRELMSLSSTLVASSAGISHSTLSAYEHEKRSASPETLARIADAIGVPVEAVRRERTDLIKGARFASNTTAMSEAVA